MKVNFKVNDKVIIKPWRSNGVVLVVDDLDPLLPYLAVDENSGDDDWFDGCELELTNDN